MATKLIQASRICAAASVLIAGCTVMPADPRQVNAENIGHLEPGMTRQEIDNIMGTSPWISRESIYTEGRLMGYLDLSVSNPYKSETLEKGLDRYEVLYYYAMPGGMDMGYWDTQYDERIVPDFFLTPVVLANGELIGIGTDTMVTMGLMKPPRRLDQQESMLRGR